MGGTNWSDAHYADRKAVRTSTAKATGRSYDTIAFAHDADVRSGKAKSAIHPSLDPKAVGFRESRDSEAHPKAIPIVYLQDVTGSMSDVPKTTQEKLPLLMGLLIRKGYVADPAILIGAIGDATCDYAPFQMGQFESGIEIENDITNLYLEGRGGGHITESYELAMYGIARHTVTDHWEKRAEKGYLFICGDEIPYGYVKSREVMAVFGESLSQDIRTEEIVAELQKKWNVFFILPGAANNASDPRVESRWRELFGQNFIKLDNANLICECIATQIGMYEGVITDANDAAGDLVNFGLSSDVAASVSRSLVPAVAGSKVQKLPTSGAASGLKTF